MKSTTFESLPLPNKDLSGISRNRYRVYSSPGQYVMVEAPNAKLALEASKVEKPYRVERDVVNFHNLVQLDDLTKATTDMERMDKPAETPHVAEYVTAPVETPPEPELPAEVKPEAKEDAPLSTEDVDKLLKG